MGRIKYCFILFLLSCSVNSTAQEPSSIHFDISNGLPSNVVFSLKQDQKGFLWIGTSAGLVRYDGSSFLSIPNLKSRAETASGLKADRNGKIWFNNFSGEIFSVVGDSISRFTAWDKYYKTGFNEFAFDQQNNLFVSNGGNYIFRFNILNNQVNFLDDSITNKQAISSMYDGTIVFTKIEATSLPFTIINKTPSKVSLIGLEKYAIKPAIFSSTYKFSNSFLNNQTIGFLRRDLNQKVPFLIYYKNKILYAHPATKLLDSLGVFPTAAYDDDAGNLFIGTENGLFWLKQKGADYYLRKHFFKSESISDIIKIKEGGIWIATISNGLYYIPNLNIWKSSGGAMGLQTEGVSHLAITQSGDIYGASFAGEVFNFRQFSEALAVKFPFYGQREVQGLAYDSFTNKLFVSKFLTQVISPNNSKAPKETISLSSPKDYVFREDGVVFSSGNRVMASVKKGNKKLVSQLLEEFHQTPEMINTNMDLTYVSIMLSNQRNKGIFYQKSSKILWAGFVDGMRYYQNNTWHIVLDTITKEPIFAVAFSELPDGTLCVATRKKGVYLLKNKKIILHLTTDNGLESNNVNKITSNKNYIWMIERNKVQAYNYKNKNFQNIGKAFNAFNLELNDIKIVHDTVFLATSKGILFFPTDINSVNTIAPFANINSFTVNEKRYSVNQLIKLPYSSNNISIDLQGSAIKSAGNFRYQYRLLGSDTNWVKVKASENMVRYASLPPGNYRFEARVVNEDGIYSKETPFVLFSIDQQWYKQWWFIFVVILIIVIILYEIFIIRLAVIKKNNQINIDKIVAQEEMRNSQLSALKAQMNPHFMFNTLNSIQEIIMVNDKKQANIYLGKFADLMRLTLDLSNNIAISLDDELKTLNLYLELEALRFEEYFQYHITLHELPFRHSIQIPAMLIQPYVENAVKHGLFHKQGEKKLEIHFSLLNEQTLLCIITDNGIGRKRADELNKMRANKHTSFATGATQRRLELLNYGKEQNITVSFIDLVDSQGNASGTKVLLYIPLIL